MSKWTKEYWNGCSESFKSEYPFEDGPVYNARQWAPLLYKEFKDWDLVIKAVEFFKQSIVIPNMDAISNVGRQIESWNGLIEWIEETKLNQSKDDNN